MAVLVNTYVTVLLYEKQIIPIYIYGRSQASLFLSRCCFTLIYWQLGRRVPAPHVEVEVVRHTEDAEDAHG